MNSNVSAAAPTVCVVLDGANVATLNSNGDRSIARLAAALAYFGSLVHGRGAMIKAVAFVPKFWLAQKPADGSRGNGLMETDDWSVLQTLEAQGLVVATPPQSHDDLFVIDYAVKHDGFIVTNDMFRDHVDKGRVFQGKKLSHRWVKAHAISFTFVGDEFLPDAAAMGALQRYSPSSSPTTPSAPISSLVASSSISSSATRSLSRQPSPHGIRDDEDDEDTEREGMAVDQTAARRRRNIDLSEASYYVFPSVLLGVLYSEDGAALERLQNETDTYIQAPKKATTEACKISIFGKQPNREHVIRVLDDLMLQAQQHFQLQLQHHQHHAPQQWHGQQHPHHHQPHHHSEDQAMDMDM